jgi:hypothetical protein
LLVEHHRKVTEDSFPKCWQNPGIDVAQLPIIQKNCLFLYLLVCKCQGTLFFVDTAPAPATLTSPFFIPMEQPYSPRRQSFGYLNAPTRSRSFDDDPEEDMYPPRELKSSRPQTDLFVSINMLATALAMLLLTTIPVVATIPDISIWFSGDALWRLFDPLITLPLNLSIMLQAEVFQTGGKPRFRKC